MLIVHQQILSCCTLKYKQMYKRTEQTDPQLFNLLLVFYYVHIYLQNCVSTLFSHFLTTIAITCFLYKYD